jgi:hypothetical protein
MTGSRPAGLSRRGGIRGKADIEKVLPNTRVFALPLFRRWGAVLFYAVPEFVWAMSDKIKSRG